MDSLTVHGVGTVPDPAVQKVAPTWTCTGEAPQVSFTFSDRDRRFQDALESEPGTPLGNLVTARHAGSLWRAVSVTPGDFPTVVLEHRIVSRMRGARGPLTAAKDVPRPAFARTLVTLRGKADWETFVPEADPSYKPPLLPEAAPSQAKAVQAQRDDERAPGFAASASFKIGWPAEKAGTASPAQKKILALAQSIGDELGADARTKDSCTCALSVETAAKNLSGGDATSSGALQVLASTAKALGVNPRDSAAVIRKYYTDGFAKYAPKGAIELARANPGWSPGQIAQACQGSAHPTRYVNVEDQAKTIRQAWSGNATGADAADSKSSFSVGPDEDFWTKSGSIAEEVNRRRFIGQTSAGVDVVYWIAESTLAKSRAYATLGPWVQGCQLSPGTIDELRQVDKLSAALVLPRERCGEIIGRQFAVVDYGVMSGAYLATKASRSSKGDQFIQVELERPRNPLKEPANPSVGSSTGGTAASQRGSQPEKVQKVKNFIDRVTAARNSYLWGGTTLAGYDCSGFASAVAKEMGVLNERYTTTGFNTFGSRGEGRWVTFWVKEIPGSPTTSHMYVTVKTGGRLRVAEAGGIRGALTGWRGPESAARRPGFTPRHAEGW